MIEGCAADVLLADKGYDDAKLDAAVEASGIQVVIPPRANRNEQREYNKLLVRDRFFHSVAAASG